MTDQPSDLMSRPLINWTDSLSDVAVLADPTAHQFIATQLQDSRGKPVVKDLSDAIADIIIETSVQGASILEVHIADPWWGLLARDPKTGECFIDVDESGMLLPLEVRYPPDSDCYWWLAACRPSSGLDAANVVLTFEDKIVSQLREVSGPRKQNSLGESRAHFIGSLVRAVPGVRYWAPSMQEMLAAEAFVGNPTQVVDGKSYTIYTGSLNPIVTPPASATAPGASGNRKNPAKTPGVVAAAGQGASSGIAGAVVDNLNQVVDGVVTLLNPNNSGYTAPIYGPGGEVVWGPGLVP